MERNFGARLADAIADFVGSWKFIIIQTLGLSGWIFINLYHLVNFDPYPFILMNLLLSAQAAYATPMILMSSNRQAQKDRKRAALDLKVDTDTNKLIRMLTDDLKMDKKQLEDHIISKEQHLLLIKKVDELIAKVDSINKPITNY